MKDRNSVKIDVMLECSLNLELENVIHSYSLKERDVRHHSSHSQHKDNILNLSSPQQKDDFNSHQRNPEEPTIIIIPGDLKNYFEPKKAKKKKQKKKTRFLGYDEEFSSEVFELRTKVTDNWTELSGVGRDLRTW